MGTRLEISTAIFTDGLYTDKLLSEEFCIVRRLYPNLLTNMLTILTNLTLFSPTRKLTRKQFEHMDLDPASFLWLKEKKLLANVLIV